MHSLQCERLEDTQSLFLILALIQAVQGFVEPSASLADDKSAFASFCIPYIFKQGIAIEEQEESRLYYPNTRLNSRQ